MSGKRYSPAETKLMAAVVRTAETNFKAKCPWCGTRPFNHKWSADHLVPLLRSSSPLVAACSSCNRRRQGKLPKGIHMERLFHSDRTVRSVPAAEMRELVNAAAESLFGSTYWVDLAIAAVDGKRPVFFWGTKQVSEHHNAKLSSVVGTLTRNVNAYHRS